MRKKQTKYLLLTLSFFLLSIFQKDFSLLAQPVITSQPTSVTSCSNTTVYFCVSTSAGSPTYQWKMCATGGGVYVNVANGTPAGATYANGTTSCLSVTFSSLTTYYFKCDVTSGGTTTTNSVSLTTVAGNTCGTGTKTYGSNTGAGWLDRSLALVPASDGLGVVMVGETAFDPTGLTDACIFKINTTMNGAFVWGRDLGSNSGGNQDNFNDLVKNTSGNYVVAGQVMDAANSLQVYLAEFPQAGGAATWTRKLGKSNYEWANAIIQHSNGDYYIAGYSAEDAGGGVYYGQIYSGRFGAASGTKVWTRHIGFGAAISTTPDEEALDLVETGSGTTAGDIILVGYTTKVPSGTNEEIAIVRQNSGGTLLSARALAPASGTGNDIGTSIKRISSGGYIIAGYTNSSGAGGYDFYVAKLNDDATLSVNWQRTIGRAGQDDYAHAVIETSDGGFVIAGYTESTTTWYDDIYVVKVSSTGALVWTRIINIGGASVDDVIYDIIEMNDGTLSAAGFTKSDPDSDILYLALNADGTITSSCTNSTGGTLNTPTFVYNDLTDNNADAAGTSGTEATNNVNLTGWPQASPCGVIILPIDLLDFTVKCNGNKRTINWTTATETNNNFFTIEHSKEGEIWSVLGTEKSVGTSTIKHSYGQAYNEENDDYKYYRLKQTDFNGEFSYSSIVTVTCLDKDKWLGAVYPNPAASEISFELYSPLEGKVQIELTDITGRIVYSTEQEVTEGTKTLTNGNDNLAKGKNTIQATIENAGYYSVNKFVKN